MYTERQMLKPGDKLALGKEYTIVKTIGTGASSIVYLAEEQIVSNVLDGLKRFVVIKELYPKYLGITRKTQGDDCEKQKLLILDYVKEKFETYRAQLLNAVRIQNNFRNQEKLANITMDMETVVEHNNTVYVVMGRVVGEAYNNVRPASLEELLTICRSIAAAVGKYHEIGYLHLDIKPENIYEIEGMNQNIKLFDFDTVHKKEDIQNHKCIASFTLEYAAPELKELDYGCDNYEDIDERTDIFSIGVILFEKLFGRLPETEDLRPFKSWDFEESDLAASASPQLKSLLTEMLRKTLALLKRLRYASVEELLVSLNRAIELAGEKIYLCDQNITTTTSKTYYVSRKNKVREIREYLEDYHIAFLCGVGGIGKSETAREYAETYRNQYEIIHFTSYFIDLKNTIASLEFVDLEDSEMVIEDRYNLRLNHLRKKELYNSNTLLVIDNYNVTRDSQEYTNNIETLKRLKQLDLHILFTSRTEPADVARKIDVENLGVNELKQMFFAINPQNREDSERIEQVEELIEAAFYHTLTVDLVAHQSVEIEQYRKKSLQDYINLLKTSGLKNEVSFSIYNNKDDNEKNATIYEHVKALFDFSDLSNEERYVMVNASLLPISGMKTSEFCEFINIVDSEWEENETITRLVNSGWIRRIGMNKEKIALHPLISEVTVNELIPEVTEEKCGIFCKNVSRHLRMRGDSQREEGYTDVSMHSAEIIVKTMHVRISYLDDSVVTNITQFLIEMACFLRRYSFYNQALAIELKILEIKEEYVLKFEWHAFVDSYLNIGQLYSILGEYEKALSYYRAALKTAEKNIETLFATFIIASGKASESAKEMLLKHGGYYNITDVYSNLGKGFLDLNQHQEALECRKKALDLRRLLYWENHLLVADSLFDLGDYYLWLDEFQTAQDFFEKALIIVKQHYSDFKLHIAKIYNGLGRCYISSENYDKAKEYLEESLRIRKEELHDVHPLLAESYSTLGLYWTSIGEENYAIDCQLKALEISKKIFGEYHPDIAKAYEKIGLAYIFAKRIPLRRTYEQALECYRKGLEVKEQLFSENHPEIADSYENMGILCARLKQYRKALEYHEKSLGIRTCALPVNSWEITNSHEYIADCYFELCEYKNALAHYQNSLDIREQNFPNRHKEIADLYKYMGKCYLKMEEYENAHGYFSASLHIQKEKLSLRDWELDDALSRLWEVVRKLKEKEKIEKNIFRRIFNKIFDKKHS